MANKIVATSTSSVKVDMVKLVVPEKSEKGGKYVFKSRIMPRDQAMEYISSKK